MYRCWHTPNRVLDLEPVTFRGLGSFVDMRLPDLRMRVKYLGHLAQPPQLGAGHLLVDVLLAWAPPQDLAVPRHLEPLRCRLPDTSETLASALGLCLTCSFESLGMGVTSIIIPLRLSAVC